MNRPQHEGNFRSVPAYRIARYPHCRRAGRAVASQHEGEWRSTPPRSEEGRAVVPENPIRVGSRLKENQGNIICDACHPPSVAMFVADLFKPRRQLEVENLFLRPSSTSPSGVHRAVCGCVGATGRCWYGCHGFGQACLGRPGSFSLTRYCGGIEQDFAPIGAGNPALGQGGLRLAVSCANSSIG